MPGVRRRGQRSLPPQAVDPVRLRRDLEARAAQESLASVVKGCG
jgi:hypothetical protein